MAKIKQLNPSVARKIAAGEVIERPASVVRELLDNAIDSKATSIEVFIYNGGLKEISVLDNGHGMDKEDLSISILPHATSKISDAQDIYNLQTLGFRGEALSSIAACSILSIASKTTTSNDGYKIEIEDAQIISSQIHNCSVGTKVSVKDIFYSLPGRKKFLKSAHGESIAIQNIFFEKVSAFPQIAFKYYSDDNLLYFLPQTTLLERIKLLYKKRFPVDLLYYHTQSFDELTKIEFIGGSPSLYRRDKKQIHIYVNNRKINEYALLQACEYGYSEMLPGGAYPVCFVFIQIDPKTVDFNIHPAKKEAKLQELDLIRSNLIALIKNFLTQFRTHNNYIDPLAKLQIPLTSDMNQPPNHGTNKEDTITDYLSNSTFTIPNNGTLAFEKIQPDDFFLQNSLYPTNNVKKEVPTFSKNEIDYSKENQITSFTTNEETNTLPRATLIGIFKNFFIIAQYQDRLFIIDQHAAHERIIFNSLIDNKITQPLLIPLPINENRDDIEFSFSQLEALKKIGIELKKLPYHNGEKQIYHICTLPASIHKDVALVASFLEELPQDTFELEKSLFATIACKKAIKEGDIIDKEFATYLANSVIRLDKPNCPHGRPLYFTLSLEQLSLLVGRTL